MSETQPTIRLLEPGDEPALEAFLCPRLASSVFLLSNARQAGLIDRGQRLQGTYVAAFDAARMVGVAAHFWNGNVVVQAPQHLPALVRAAVTASGRAVEGVLGPCDQVSAAMAALGLDQSTLQMDEPEDLFALKLVELIVPNILRSGQVRGRRIEPRDTGLVSAWRVAFNTEALGAADTPELRRQCRANVQRAVENRDLWVLEHGGRLVATSGFNARLPELVQIGGVYTPPELRGRGYGRAVVAASLLDARAEGVQQAILFTGQANRPAIKAYTALGFQRVGDYRIVLLREPIFPECSP